MIAAWILCGTLVVAQEDVTEQRELASQVRRLVRQLNHDVVAQRNAACKILGRYGLIFG